MLLFIFHLLNLTVNAKVTNVTLYPDRALVTRTATLDLKGEEEVIIPNLTPFLDDGNVKVRGEGLTIGDVRVKRTYVEKPSPQVQELEKKIKETEEKIKKKEDEKEVLKAKEEFLNSIKLGTPEIIAKELREGKVSTLAWREAINFLFQEYTQLKASLLVMEKEKEELKRRLTALQKELAEIRALTENKKEIVFRALPKSEKQKITIDYLVPQEVYWQPIYEVIADLEEKGATLVSYVKIWQRTGEDWEDVQMVISTARPLTFAILPEVDPWFVDLIEEVPVWKREDLKTMLEEARPFPEAPLEGVKRVETGISLQYLLPKKGTLKSGETEKRFLVGEAKLPAEYEFFAIPKLAEKVFMKGRVFNNTEDLFLAGEVSTYIGSEYTGKGSLSDFTPQETIDMNFGGDERVKVRRELVKVFTKKAGGIFGGREKKEFLYRITMENYRPGSIRFSLSDLYPISRRGEISVKLTRIFPERYEEDKEKGVITWKGELERGNKFIAELGFTVEYPRGKRVSGL